MHTWRVGDVDIVRIEDENFAVPAPAPPAGWMIPTFATDDGEVRIAFSALAIRTPTRRIVVDPWLANDHPRSQPDAADHAGKLLEELAAAGFPPDDVGLVVNTHCDGIGWNTRPGPDNQWLPSFPNARYLYPAAELAAIDAGADIYGAGELTVLREAGLVDGIEPPTSLGPEVELVDAPGHNPGHVAVRVESRGDFAVIPGHLVLSPFQVADPGTTLAGEEPLQLVAAAATRRAMLDELADRNGLLVTTLVGGPGGGRITRAEHGGTVTYALADQEDGHGGA